MRLTPAALLLCSACYTYAPVIAPGPAPGALVNAGLTPEGTAALGPVLGPEVAEVEGRVVAATADTLRLALRSASSTRGILMSWRGEEVPLPRARLAFLSQRRLSTGGTIVLGTGVAAGLVLLYRLLGGPGVFGASGGSGGGPGR
jgi:hypothetical protein